MEYLDEAKRVLAGLVAIPSVSAENRAAEAAPVVAELLRDLGLQVELLPGFGPPVVFAEGGEGDKSLLFYNHYDVQPPDPLELWESDPFTLSERNGAWYGRGANDNKGEFVARLFALKMFQRKHGFLPHVKILLEGEEEVGSPHLGAFVEQHAGKLEAEAIIWESGGVSAQGRPLIYAGLKGILTVELRVKTAASDLHSSLGAVVDNPIYRLSLAIASLRDEDGRVLIPGFYAPVRPLAPAEEEALSEIPEESEEFLQALGVRRALGGARGRDFYARLFCEPCVNINGLHAGYGGPGVKTVLPAEASAKLDFRLVPDQEPREILALLRQHLEAQGVGDVEVMALGKGERPARSNLSHPFFGLVRQALEEAFGQKPVLYPSMTGSGPMSPFLQHVGAPVAGIGVGYPGSNVHAPNEHIRVRDFARGVLGLLRVLELFFGVLGS